MDQTIDLENDIPQEFSNTMTPQQSDFTVFQMRDATVANRSSTRTLSADTVPPPPPFIPHPTLTTANSTHNHQTKLSEPNKNSLSANINRSSPQRSKPNKDGSLLRLFQSDLFDAYFHMYYLYHRQEPGIQDYLVNLLYRRSEEDIYFYLPQLCCLCLARYKTSSLYRFILEKASKSMHLALKTSWLFQSASEEHFHDVSGISVQLNQEVEMAIVNSKPVPPGSAAYTPSSLDIEVPDLFQRQRAIHKLHHATVQNLSRRSQQQKSSPSEQRDTQQHEIEEDVLLNTERQQQQPPPPPPQQPLATTEYLQKPDTTTILSTAASIDPSLVEADKQAELPVVALNIEPCLKKKKDDNSSQSFLPTATAEPPQRLLDDNPSSSIAAAVYTTMDYTGSTPPLASQVTPLPTATVASSVQQPQTAALEDKVSVYAEQQQSVKTTSASQSENASVSLKNQQSPDYLTSPVIPTTTRRGSRSSLRQKVAAGFVKRAGIMTLPGSRLKLPSIYSKLGSPFSYSAFRDDSTLMGVEMQRFIVKQRRCDYYNMLNTSISTMIDVSNKLAQEPDRSLRLQLMQGFLEAVNEWMFCRRCIVAASEGTFAMTGLTIPLSEFGSLSPTGTNTHSTQIVRLITDECKVLSSKKRAPYLLVFEVADLDEDLRQLPSVFHMTTSEFSQAVLSGHSENEGDLNTLHSAEISDLKTYDGEDELNLSNVSSCRPRISSAVEPLWSHLYVYDCIVDELKERKVYKPLVDSDLTPASPLAILRHAMGLKRRKSSVDFIDHREGGADPSSSDQQQSSSPMAARQQDSPSTKTLDLASTETSPPKVSPENISAAFNIPTLNKSSLLQRQLNLPDLSTTEDSHIITSHSAPPDSPRHLDSPTSERITRVLTIGALTDEDSPSPPTLFKESQQQKGQRIDGPLLSEENVLEALGHTSSTAPTKIYSPHAEPRRRSTGPTRTSSSRHSNPREKQALEARDIDSHSKRSIGTTSFMSTTGVFGVPTYGLASFMGSGALNYASPSNRDNQNSSKTKSILSSEPSSSRSNVELFSKSPTRSSLPVTAGAFPQESQDEALTTRSDIDRQSSFSDEDDLKPSDEVGSTLSTTAADLAAKAKQLRYRLWGALWREKKEKYRKLSPYGKLKSWNLGCVLVKGGDDVRQEMLASQLVRQFKWIFEEARLPLYLRPYEILVTGPSSGIMVFVPDTVSLDSLKKSYGNDSIAKVFEAAFADNPYQAKKNFIESHAAYSVIGYLLQVKDRHNGNFLLDAEGHIIHIDYGFMLSNSPGNVNFESSPFKLTTEFMDIMDGEVSDNYEYFRTLVIRGFLEARKHAERLFLLVEMMQSATKMPCFAAGPEATVAAMKDRFMLNLTEETCIQKIVDLIDISVNNWRTIQYDNFQRITNGIL